MKVWGKLSDAPFYFAKTSGEMFNLWYESNVYVKSILWPDNNRISPRFGNQSR